MQHTIGYTVEGSLPIQIAYNCSKCGYLNIQKCVLHAQEFGFTKAEANANCSDALNARIKTIQDSKDSYALRSAGIEGKCRKCKYVEHWSHKEGITSWGAIRIVLFIVMVLLFGIPIYQAITETNVASSPSLPQAQYSLGIIIPIVLAVIVLIVIIITFAKGNKKEVVSKAALPVIVSVGETRGGSEEEAVFRKISLFMEIDKEHFIKKIHKCKDAKRIRKAVEDLGKMYSILFDDIISSLDELTKTEELEGTNQKDTAINLIEAHLAMIEDEAPLDYLNYLAYTQ